MQGYFAAMSGQELDSRQGTAALYRRVARALGLEPELSLAAKRRFLTTFWQKRDPTPGTARNERRRRSTRPWLMPTGPTRKGAGRRYPAGGRTGAAFSPDTAPRRRAPAAAGGPGSTVRGLALHEGKGAYYIFADRTGFGAFQLIYTNDLREPGIAGWSEVVGRRAVANVGEYLGVDLFAVSNGTTPAQASVFKWVHDREGILTRPPH